MLVMFTLIHQAALLWIPRETFLYVCDTGSNNIRKINTTGFGSNLADNTSLTPCFSDGRGGDALSTHQMI
jgi:hypothetical protein